MNLQFRSLELEERLSLGPGPAQVTKVIRCHLTTRGRGMGQQRQMKLRQQ